MPSFNSLIDLAKFYAENEELADLVKKLPLSAQRACDAVIEASILGVIKPVDPTPYPMPAPWRIEAKSSPFHPWIIVEPTVHRLERAITHADEMKKAFRYYATRIRAN